MRNIFIENEKAIDAIGTKYGMDNGVACSMFASNCVNFKNKKAEFYEGAVGVNYGDLYKIYMNIPGNIWMGMQRDYTMYKNKQILKGKAAAEKFKADAEAQDAAEIKAANAKIAEKTVEKAVEVKTVKKGE